MKLGSKTVGRGKTNVVLVHDIGGDHRNYEPMLPYIDGDLFTYTFVDFRGYGMSKELKGAYTLEEAAGDIIDTIDELGYEKVHFVCHSMSGMIGQKLALTVPDRIESIVAIAPVLASGFGLDEATAQFMSNAFQSEESLAKLLVDFRGLEFITKKWYEFKAKRWWECSNPEAVLGYFNMINANNFEEEAKSLKTPHLIITGAHDMELMREAAIRNSFAGRLPDVRIETIANASHHPMQETPVWLASMIEDFIKAKTVELAR